MITKNCDVFTIFKLIIYALNQIDEKHLFHFFSFLFF